MSKLLLFVLVIATCHLLTCYGDSVPTCVVGQQNGTFVCSFCKSIPNVPLDIKQHIDLSRVPLKIANLIPGGLSWGTTIRLSDYIGADVSRFGLQNSYTFNVDIKDALNNLLTVNADVARGLTDSVVEKLLVSTQAFGDVCVDVKFSLCKQDVVLIGRFGAFKLFELPYSLFPSYKTCKSAFIPGKKIGYDVDTRSLTLCTDFVSLLYRNTMCVELKDIMWGGKGVHACPSISLGTTLANGNTFNADLPCFSIGDPDPCYTRTSCDSCVEDITCSWCSARKSCLSKAQALDPCSGCLAGFVETCDAAELQRENETCSDFYLFDTDNDWTVTRAEFNSELGYYLPADQAEETFAEYDLDQDGQITYREFKQVRVAGLSAGAVAGIVIVTLLGVTAGAVVVTGVVLKKKKPETYNTVKGKLNSAWETTKTKSGTVRDKLKGAWGVVQAKATSLRSPS